MMIDFQTVNIVGKSKLKNYVDYLREQNDINTFQIKTRIRI